jgi:hypothetical protein
VSGLALPLADIIAGIVDKATNMGIRESSRTCVTGGMGNND